MKTSGIIILAVLLIAGAMSCTNKKGRLPQPDLSVSNSASQCDSVNVSYSKQVMPVLKDNCYSCHSTAVTTATGGLDLENFASLKNYLNYQFHADSVYGSKFMHIVEQAMGVIPMPPTGKLSDCQLAAIRSWIGNGAPSN